MLSHIKILLCCTSEKEMEKKWFDRAPTYLSGGEPTTEMIWNRYTAADLVVLLLGEFQCL